MEIVNLKGYAVALGAQTSQTIDNVWKTANDKIIQSTKNGIW
jgi:hypothetical protein